jgi:hypothetical protein
MHRIAYDRDYDATCPQCLLSGIMPPAQLEYDEVAAKPLDRSGKPLDARGPLPVA